MEKNVRIQTYNISQFGYFLNKLKNMPDGDGHCSITRCCFHGSNMSNSNAHDHFPLPNLVIGGAAGRMKGGRHLSTRSHTDDEPAGYDARQGGREAGITR